MTTASCAACRCSSTTTASSTSRSPSRSRASRRTRRRSSSRSSPSSRRASPTCELGETRIPVDAQGAVLIPFRGPLGSFRYISATHVLNGQAPADALAGAIVLIGASAPGLQDVRAVPVAKEYIGVEAHANLVSGLLDGTIPSRPPQSRAGRDRRAAPDRAGHRAAAAAARAARGLRPVPRADRGRDRRQPAAVVALRPGAAARLAAGLHDHRRAAAADLGLLHRDPATAAPVAHLRPVRADGSGQGTGRRRRGSVARGREPRDVGAVLRRPRLHDDLGRPRPARTDAADERVPDADHRGDPPAPRHDRQVHGRRRDGVLGRAARRRGSRPSRRAGGPRHGRRDARPETRPSRRAAGPRSRSASASRAAR